MDDVLEKAKETVRVDSRGRGAAAASAGSTFLGGTPDQTLSNLTGCISNVFIKRFEALRKNPQSTFSRSIRHNVFITLVFRETSPQMVLNLLKAKENVNVALDCPAARKPQQIVAAMPKHSNKPKVPTTSAALLWSSRSSTAAAPLTLSVLQGKHKKPSGSRSRNTRESCRGELSDQETGATHFSGSTHSYQRYDSLPISFSSK